MFSLTVNSDLDRAASFVDAILAGLKADALRHVAGKAASQVVVDHFHDLANTRHRGYDDIDFWLDAADAVTHDVTPHGAVITVDKAGVHLRRHGGTVEPVNAKFLWIPVHPDAVGLDPEDAFEDMAIIIGKSGQTGVAIKKAAGGARRNKRGQFRRQTGDIGDVYYALVTSTTHREDTSVDPDPDKLLDAVTAAQLEWLAKEVFKP
jgi:hypothetical protein